MFPTASQNTKSRFQSSDKPDVNVATAAQVALEDLAAVELPFVAGGANVLAVSAGDGVVPFDFNPWYSLTYARFAIRTGAPL
jgi:hypothetical protein